MVLWGGRRPGLHLCFPLSGVLYLFRAPFCFVAGVVEEEGSLFFGFVSPMFEVAKNNAEMVKLLLHEGATVDYECKGGWTALSYAVHSSDYYRKGPESPSPYAPLRSPR